MNAKSLYIASMEASSGKLLITMRIMNLLVQRFEKVAFFRPIIDERKGIDNDIELIRSRYCPAMSYKDCYAFKAEEVKTLATKGKIKDVYEKLLNQVNEARRCMSCGNCFEYDNCYGVCPNNAIMKLGTGKGFEIKYDYCKGCGIC